MPATVLIVDANLARGCQLGRTISSIAEVDVATTFAEARRLLAAKLPDFLVTNLRLGAYNGLHLVYTAATSHVATHSIVYTDAPEPGLGIEVQGAGAFYETFEHLRGALPSYIGAQLPARDRRDVWRVVLESSLPPGHAAGQHVASWFAH